MKRFFWNTTSLVATLTTAGILLHACGKKSNSDDTPQASSLADLKLSSALSIAIPDSMKKAGGATSARLKLRSSKLAGKKSSEACRAMAAANEIFTNLAQASASLCHMEVESDRMKFGTKYQVNVTGLPSLAGQSLQLWVDNSDAANLKVYTCQNGTLTEKFEVTGFNGTGKSKGTVSQKFEGSESGMNFSGGVNLDFDLTVAGTTRVTASMKSDVSGSQTGSYRRYADMSILDAGVSTLLISAEGTSGPMSFSDQAAMSFDGTIGQSLYSGSYNDGSQSVPAFTSRSTFDAEGMVIDTSLATPAIIIDKAKLPAKLAANFAPVAPSGWDCSGTTETIDVDLSGADKAEAHAACDVEWDEPADCYGSDFDFGTAE
jgi:hypothetical protein